MERATSKELDSILGIKIPVLDKGFIVPLDYMGTDESIVDAARISYGQGTRKVSDDRNLIRYLMRHRHTTPFEQCQIKFHVKVPMDTWRQWIRHRTMSVNEYCLALGTKVLKTDLTWVNIEDLTIEDSIIGFQEEPLALRRNNLIPSKVLNTVKITAPCLKLITTEGEIIASEEHLWVARTSSKSSSYKWIKTNELKVGMDIAFTSKPWSVETSYDAGWLAGMFDGEGWLSIDKDRSTHIGIAQRDGTVLKKIESMLKERGIYCTKYIQNKSINGDCWTLAVQSRWSGLRLLGSIRPLRLIEKSEKWFEGGRVTTTPAKIIKIENIGIREVIGLKTETNTLIANGFLSHNSTRYSVAIDDKQETLPNKWRLQSGSNNQGSDGYIGNSFGIYLTRRESDLHNLAQEVYNERLKDGVAREQARKDLPLSTYTEAIFSINLHNLLHFLSLRMDSHAQEEIRTYANEIGKIVEKWVPFTWEAFVDYRFNSITFSNKEIEALKKLDFIMKWTPEQTEHSLNKRELKEFKDKLDRIINGGI